METLSWITEFNTLAKLLGDCYGGSKNVEAGPTRMRKTCQIAMTHSGRKAKNAHRNGNAKVDALCKTSHQGTLLHGRAQRIRQIAMEYVHWWRWEGS